MLRQVCRGTLGIIRRTERQSSLHVLCLAVATGGLISSGVKPCGVKWKPGGMISNGVKSGRSVRSVEVVKPIDVVKPRASVKLAVSVGAGVGDGSGISVGSGVGVGARVGVDVVVACSFGSRGFGKRWSAVRLFGRCRFRIHRRLSRRRGSRCNNHRLCALEGPFGCRQVQRHVRILHS